MTIFKQLLHNWEKGYFSVVEGDCNILVDTRKFAIATFWDEKEFHISEWYNTEKDAKENAGGDYYYSKKDILEESERYNWKVYTTLHPSEMMGKGLKKGDKVLIKIGDKIREIKKVEDTKYWTVLSDDGGGINYNPKTISPLLNEETELSLQEGGDRIIKILEKEMVKCNSDSCNKSWKGYNHGIKNAISIIKEAKILQPLANMTDEELNKQYYVTVRVKSELEKKIKAIIIEESKRACLKGML